MLFTFKWISLRYRFGHILLLICKCYVNWICWVNVKLIFYWTFKTTKETTQNESLIHSVISVRWVLFSIFIIFLDYWKGHNNTCILCTQSFSAYFQMWNINTSCCNSPINKQTDNLEKALNDLSMYIALYLYKNSHIFTF